MEVTQVVKPFSKERGYYLQDAAKLLGCSVMTIRNRMKAGLIPKEKLNGRIWISEKSLAILEQE